MGYFVDPQGAYYEGDRAHSLDVAVPKRLSQDHLWDGVTWQLNPRPAILRQLAALDAAAGMGRGLREFILASVAMRDILAQTTATLPDVSANQGIIKVRQIEQLASALRAQLA